MKVVISYPPLDTAKGCATLGQNRQFQYFREPTHIYPVVPAIAATMLKKAGHEVVWNDCLAGGYTQDDFFSFLARETPDLLAFETKTPVVKQHWRLIRRIKAEFPGIRCLLFGDHVTALPEESFANSPVDYVLTGGDYDFLLVNLCETLRASGCGSSGEPVLLAPKAEQALGLKPGIYYRDGPHVRNTGRFELAHDLSKLPFIDRSLTRWELYAYKNGNYKRTPGTYLMSARDCWWGKCTFCSWPALYPRYRARSPGNVLDEIEELVSRRGVREIMDDSGCFPVGDWLRRFSRGMIERGLSRKVFLDANMRFGALNRDEFRLMKDAGFRLLLFGLESASQSTLDRINKNVTVERIVEDCKHARRAGLFPHITIMFGYPWETGEDARRTCELGRWLLRKGYAYTMQATVVIPYPGSALYEECAGRGWLKTLDWDDYDMKQPVMRTSLADEELMGYVRRMYRVSFTPGFIMRKLWSVRDLEDIGYFLRAGRKVAGHIFDFERRKPA